MEATEAQRIIDKEIAVHEAAILDLKHRRNTYSSISRLPTEIIAEIFLLVKAYIHHFAAPSIIRVCRQWRQILLASPRVWSSIDFSRTDPALKSLGRSQSVPLQVSCEHVRYYTESHLRVAEAVMADVDRIQRLHLLLPANELLHFLRLNGGKSAPMLEDLRLVIENPSAESLSLPPDILGRGMPSLRQLDLTSINITSQLPPLPHLTHLSIWGFGLRPSVLLSSLQHTPKLEDLDIQGLAIVASPTQQSIPVQLPNLNRISIESDMLEGLAIITNIEYPPSARVHFLNDDECLGQPDLPAFLKVFRRFADIGPLMVDKVELGARYYGVFQMTIYTRHHGPSQHHLDLTFIIEDHHGLPFYLALCAALPLGNVPVLQIIGDFDNMLLAQWTSLYRYFIQVRSLRLKDASTRGLGPLMKSSSTELPLPRLETLYLSGCELDDATSLQAVKDLLEERKALGIPIGTTTIRSCPITAEVVEELEELTDIDWDDDDSRVWS